MNKYSLLLRLLILLPVIIFSTTNVIANSTITIKVPYTIDILEIDGKPYQAPNIIDGHYLLKLASGEHSLVVQYYANWNTVDESGNLIKWKPVALTHDFQQSQTYTINHFQPKDAEAAEAKISSPDIWLSVNNKTIAQGTTIDRKKSYTSIFSQRNTRSPKKNLNQGEISFTDWQKKKTGNSAEYQKFKDYLEYQEYLQYLDYLKQQ